MKDYKERISMESTNNIYTFFSERGYNIQFFSGSLLDNYLIEIGENNYKMGRVKVRKYIIIHEIALNEWSSDLEMILTDNEKLFKEYEASFNTEQEETA